MGVRVTGITELISWIRKKRTFMFGPWSRSTWGLRPRRRSKIWCPIDLAWSRGLVTVKNRGFWHCLKKRVFVVVEKNESCSRCPDRDAGLFFYWFSFLYFLVLGGGCPQWPAPLYWLRARTVPNEADGLVVARVDGGLARVHAVAIHCAIAWGRRSLLEHWNYHPPNWVYQDWVHGRKTKKRNFEKIVQRHDQDI